MKLILQRVSQAQVSVDKKVIGKIDQGVLVLLGVRQGDSRIEVDQLVKKVSELRMFNDEQGKMNCSIQDAGGAFLVVSQFTIYGNCQKGRRPSFNDAADPELAKELYEYFVDELKKKNFQVETGKFGAMMEVSLTNDGPVTFILES